MSVACVREAWCRDDGGGESGNADGDECKEGGGYAGGPTVRGVLAVSRRRGRCDRSPLSFFDTPATLSVSGNLGDTRKSYHGRSRCPRSRVRHQHRIEHRMAWSGSRASKDSGSIVDRRERPQRLAIVSFWMTLGVSAFVFLAYVAYVALRRLGRLLLRRHSAAAATPRVVQLDRPASGARL